MTSGKGIRFVNNLVEGQEYYGGCIMTGQRDIILNRDLSSG